MVEYYMGLQCVVQAEHEYVVSITTYLESNHVYVHSDRFHAPEVAADLAI